MIVIVCITKQWLLLVPPDYYILYPTVYNNHLLSLHNGIYKHAFALKLRYPETHTMYTL